LRINTPKLKSKGIYIVTNTINNKQYVGMDTNMPLRFDQHIKGITKCRLLHEALSATGLENWSVQFVPYPGLSIKDLQAIKRWYIRERKTEHPNGYNTPLGSDPNPEHPDPPSKCSFQSRTDLKAQVRERRKSGALLETIAAEFGLLSATVGRWCRDIQDVKAVRDYPVKTQVRERRKAGATLQVIATEFDISISTASRWCEDIKVLSATETEIIGLLADGQLWTPSDIQQHSKVTRQAVMFALKSLLENGLITKIKKGCYQKVGEGA